MKQIDKICFYCIGTVLTAFSICLLVVVAVLALPALLVPNGKHYYINQLESIDQLVNVHYCGDPDETISSRRGKGSRSNLLRKFIDLLFSKGHCAKHIEYDEGRKAL